MKGAATRITPAISTPVLPHSFTDAATDAVARAIVGMQRQAARENELREAEHRARLAELDAQLARLDRQVSERLAGVKDGEPGRSLTAEDVAPLIAAEVAKVAEPLQAEIERLQSALTERPAAPTTEAVRSMIDEAIQALPPPEAVLTDDLLNTISADAHRAAVAAGQAAAEMALAAIPTPKNGEPGRDADPAEIERIVDERVAAAVAAIPVPKDGEPGAQGPPGALPIIQAWADGVCYQGDVVTHRGAVFQAIRDTGKEPGHEDWRCIIERGNDGQDGRSINPRGLYDPAGEYRALDVVMLNGASFVAKTDEPGPCPGDGWNLLAMQGKQGKPGVPGEPGQRGLAVTASVRSAHVSDEGLLTLTNADGSTVECDLYPLLSGLAR